MINILDYSVEYYRDRYEKDKEIQLLILALFKSAYKLKENSKKSERSNARAIKTAYCALILLVNGKTTIPTYLESLINEAIASKELDKSFTQGYYYQTGYMFWNVKDIKGEYVDWYYADQTDNVGPGNKASNTGKGYSEKRKRYYKRDILQKSIREVLDDVTRQVYSSNILSENDKIKKARAVNYFREQLDGMNMLGNIGKSDESIIMTDTQIPDLSFSVSINEIKYEQTIPPKFEENKSTNTIRTDSVIRSMSDKDAGKREQNRKKTGNRGEKIALKIEKDRLARIGRQDLIPQIDYVAQREDGRGYDIISIDIDPNGTTRNIYIEVKATQGSISTPFYLSFREWRAAKQFQDDYKIYRIYEMSSDNSKVKYYCITGKELMQIDLKPSTFIITPHQETGN